MKNVITLILAIMIMFQSCSVYKNTNFDDIKEGKNYLITMTTGKEIEAKCTSVIDGSAFFKINDLDVKIPFDKISQIKRKKVSPTVLIGGIGLAAIIGILVIKDNKKEGRPDGE